MRVWKCALAVACLLPSFSSAAIVGYKGYERSNLAGKGAWAQMVDNNTVAIGDRSGTFLSIAGVPDADDDDQNTGGNGAAFQNSIWINTTPAPDSVYRCLNASVGAAVWQKIGDMSDLIDDTSPQLGANLDTQAFDITGTGDLTMDTLSTDYIDLTTGLAEPTYSEGRLFYNDDAKTLSFYLDEEDVTVDISREMHIRVFNDSGAEIVDGAAVYLDDSQGGMPTIALAKADAPSTCRVVALATHDIGDNATGMVTTFGDVHNQDTSAWAPNTLLYLSDSVAGDLTLTPPVAPSFVVKVGTVEVQHASAGLVFVKIDNADVCGSVVINQLDVNTTLDVAGVTTTADVVAPESLGNAQFKIVQPGVTIQATIDGISDATANKPYAVLIPPGIWTEQITLKDYVSIQGTGIGSTIISVLVSTGGSGVQAGTIELANEVTISNMTIRAASVVANDAAVGIISTGDNDVYRVHDVDFDVTWDTIFIEHASNIGHIWNCTGTTEFDGYSIVGAGAGNSEMYIYACHLTRASTENHAHQGFVWNNITSAKQYIYGCTFDGGSDSNQAQPSSLKNSGTMRVFDTDVVCATANATNALGYVSGDASATVTFHGGRILVTGGTPFDLFGVVGAIEVRGLEYTTSSIGGSATLAGYSDVAGELRVGDQTANYAAISDTTGDLTFVGTSGVPYAEISVVGNVTADTVDTTKIQFTRFDTNGESNNCTPDHTNDHITITKAGRYMIIISISAQGDDAQSIELDVSCWKNNGATELTNVHNHRSFAGGVTRLGSIPLSGIHNFTANDTLELWIEGQANRDVILSDVTMTVYQLGG